jgi:hypothetical protein
VADPVDVVAHLVELAELDQAGDGVQAVGELVRLRPQRVGGASVGVQLLLQRHELGPVPQCHDRADRVVVQGDRHPVHDQHAALAQHDLVAALGAAGQHVLQPVVEVKLGHRPADGVRRQ